MFLANYTEYVNSGVKKILKLHGIQHQRTAGFTPEQNGAAEREKETKPNNSRSHEDNDLWKNLPLKMWAERANTSVYLMNHSGTSPQQLKTQYEIFFVCRARLEKLFNFGATAYVHIPKDTHRKLDSKSVNSYFVGSDEHIKEIRIWFRKLI